MGVTEQYALDLYRARRREEPLPPAPGRYDWRTVRELREYGHLRRVVERRPAPRRRRHALTRPLTDALTRLLTRRRRTP
ncbi:hypothetical protein ACFVT5_26410 [Streptomyces sp. NPDC058001]|uniref:hypothetical protein n=1 Tax=Streptomyces sp. NPDC058001 TaxID=3346300 RepID=UPI0036EB9F93